MSSSASAVLSPRQPTGEDPVALLREAVRCITVNPPGDELALAELLADRLAAAGIAADLRVAEEGRANLTATLRMAAPGPRLVLSGHLDTVPIGESRWRHPPFEGAVEAGRMYGRGTADMKGGLVALLLAFLAVHAAGGAGLAGELVFAATYGEETGSHGAQRMIEDGQLDRFDAMIVAEPTGNAPIIAHKGALWVKATAYGRTAHSSAPAEGANAIDLIHAFRSALAELSLPDDPAGLLSPATLAVTRIAGGKGNNVIPDACSMTIDLRTLPGQSHAALLAELRGIGERLAATMPGTRLEVEALVDLPGSSCPPDAPVVTAALAALAECGLPQTRPGAANYFTDASVFRAVGGDILILGPGRAAEAHQTDENIEIAAFLAAIDIYRGIIARTLAADAARPSDPPTMRKP